MNKQALLFCFLSLVLIPGCNLHIGVWNRVSIPDGASEISGFDGNMVWLADLFGEKLVLYSPYVVSNNQFTTIPLPVDHLSQMCVTASDVWIVTWARNEAIHYDPAAQAFEKKPELSGSRHVSCHEQPGQIVSFVVDDRIALTDGEQWGWIEAPIGCRPVDFTLDPGGDMWLTTTQGDVYTKHPADETWLLKGASEGRFMAWTGPDVLWLHNGKSVYRWVVSGDSQPELIFNTEEYVRNIVEVSDGVTWIVAGDGIWAYGNNKLDQVSFSWERNLLSMDSRYENVLIDRQNSILYVITSWDIYSSVLSFTLH